MLQMTDEKVQVGIPSQGIIGTQVLRSFHPLQALSKVTSITGGNP